MTKKRATRKLARKGRPHRPTSAIALREDAFVAALLDGTGRTGKATANGSVPGISVLFRELAR
jgi:hypothetical protein